MEHLIPMTDFVIQILDANYEFSEIRMLNTIQSYALFLKKPLKLGYFIPCDENDVPLEQPINWKAYQLDICRCEKCIEKTLECDKYLEAKQRVLFEVEDFKIGELNNEKAFWIKNRGGQIIKDLKLFTIEDIIHWNLKLTETAKKEIGI